MRAAILSVGSELLLGDLVDTNASWLSRRLTELGIQVTAHATAGDDLGPLTAAIRWLGERVDVLLIGGGLGPTHDDLTREAVAEVAGVALEQRPDLEEQIIQRFAAMGARMPAQNLQQARVPAGATAYPPVGTAPTFSLELELGERACLVYVLPGVPWELQELFDRDVVPSLLELTGGGVTVTRTIHVSGRGESSVAEDLEPLRHQIERDRSATLSFLAKQREIEVRLTVSAQDRDAAREASQPLVDRVLELVGAAVAGVDEEALEHVVLRLLEGVGQTVATAESCTAGEVVARLAAPPGAAAVVRGGLAAYATEVKRDVLGIDPGLLDEHGPVSEEVTRALASRARELFAADWGIGVTCAAGPSGQGQAEVGDSFWALAHPDGAVECHHRRFPGDRDTVKARLGTVALELLKRRLVEAGDRPVGAGG
ncbi:MAG TPA: CinA family nicotinamide mononucleotide deamidase-related protein [Nitriliruptorales bacterium]